MHHIINKKYPPFLYYNISFKDGYNPDIGIDLNTKKIVYSGHEDEPCIEIKEINIYNSEIDILDGEDNYIFSISQ